jgi:hypothetical protein
MDPRRKARWPKAMPQVPMPLPPRAADQSHARLDSGRRGRRTDTGAVPALAAPRPSKAIRSSFSKPSTTTRVSAPCAPPPCSVRLMNLISTLGGRIRERLVCRPITTLPSIVDCSLSRRRPTRNAAPLVHVEMYGAGLTGGNADQVLYGCAPVIALSANMEHRSVWRCTRSAIFSRSARR